MNESDLIPKNSLENCNTAANTAPNVEADRAREESPDAFTFAEKMMHPRNAGINRSAAQTAEALAEKTRIRSFEDQNRFDNIKIANARKIAFELDSTKDEALVTKILAKSTVRMATVTTIEEESQVLPQNREKTSIDCSSMIVKPVARKK